MVPTTLQVRLHFFNSFSAVNTSSSPKGENNISAPASAFLEISSIFLEISSKVSLNFVFSSLYFAYISIFNLYR